MIAMNKQFVLLFAMLCISAAGFSAGDWWHTTHPATCVVGWR